MNSIQQKIHYIDTPITINEFNNMTNLMFGELVKAVVDVKKKVMAINAELHADEEKFLLEQKDSQQDDVRGINLYPDDFDTEDFIEFDSMINLRPQQNNRSRGVDDTQTQQRIRDIVALLITQ